MRDPHLRDLAAPPALRPMDPGERVRVVVLNLILGAAVLMLIAFFVGAVLSLGLDTERGRFAVALLVALILGGVSWRTR